MLSDIEQGVFVRAPHRVEPFERDAIAEQCVVADTDKQQRLGGVWRGGGHRNGRNFDSFRQFDELCGAGHRMPFDLAPLGPGIGGVVVGDIAEEQATRRPVDDHPEVVIDAHRPEIRITRAVEPMKA